MMLAVKVTFLISDQDNIIFTNLGDYACLWVGLVQTIDPGKVFIYTILIFPSESAVVCDSPFHLSSIKLGMFSVRIKDFGVQIRKVSDNDTSAKEDPINLSVVFSVHQRRV